MNDAVPMWSPRPGRLGPIFAVPSRCPSSSSTTVSPGGDSIHQPRPDSTVRASGKGWVAPPATIPRKTGQIRGQSSSVAARIRPSLTRLAVDRLPDQVGVAVVPGVLLDQVHQDPAQAEGALALAAALLRRLAVQPRRRGESGVDDRVGTAYGLVEECP